MQRRMKGYLQTLRVENEGLAQSETSRRFISSFSSSPNPVPLAAKEGDRGRGRGACSRKAAVRYCLSATSLLFWSQVTQPTMPVCLAAAGPSPGRGDLAASGWAGLQEGIRAVVAENAMVWYDSAGEFDAVNRLDSGMTDEAVSRSWLMSHTPEGRRSPRLLDPAPGRRRSPRSWACPPTRTDRHLPLRMAADRHRSSAPVGSLCC
jgi:hypothetical protein